MKAAVIVLSTVVVALGGGGAYFFFQEYQPVRQHDAHVTAANLDLERKVNDLEEELNAKVSELTKTRREKEEEIEQIRTAKDSLISHMKNEIDNNQIQITQLADKLKVSIVDKILFPSGEADITDEGLQVLERVGNVLKKVEDKIIRVEGHTDNVPISTRLQKEFPSNWELSTARATNVVRFLQETVEIDPSRLEAVGMGEHQPIAPNDTKETRAQNRRIEIALLPVR